ncbi:MAG: class I SAM-dependent methyltransferase, partial [Pikeienuella sp.]
MDKRKPFVAGAYYSSSDGKQRFLRDIFDKTAPYYEGIANWGWFGSGGVYRRTALRRVGLEPHMRAVDVASGTGPVARAILSIIKDPERLVCVEPSAGMIAESRKTVPALHLQSTAENLPVESESFDFLTMGFALRHVDDLEDSFREFHRVLKPGGKAFIMDITLPENRIGRFFFRAYFKHVLPFFTLIFSRDRDAYRLMKYYW